MKGGGFSFVWRAAAVLAAALAVSYVSYSAAGVFGRSTDSVAGTRWVSFGQSAVSFGSDDGEISTEGSSRAFSYEENAGAVIATFPEGGSMRFTRFYSDRLMSADGKTVFYLTEEVN